MPKYSMTLNQKVHRNHAIFQDYISGRSIIKISRKYGLTYDRTRTIIKEHSMRQYFVIDHADDFVLYRGTLEQCETVLQESYKQTSHIWANFDDKRRCIACDISWHPARDKSKCSSTNTLPPTYLKESHDEHHN